MVILEVKVNTLSGYYRSNARIYAKERILYSNVESYGIIGQGKIKC